MSHVSDSPATATEAAPEWRLADGTAYRGEVFRDRDGKPLGEAWVSCPSCSGNGRKGGRTCQACNGDSETWDRVRLQTAGEFAAKSRRRDSTRARKEALAAEREAGRLAKWEAFASTEAPLVARIRASGDAFALEVLDKARTYGGMTDRQREAVVTHLDKAAADLALHARSAPVGREGDKVELTVTCLRRWSFIGKGHCRSGSREVFVTEMMDDDGNALGVASEGFRLNEGDRATISGTVKEHDSKSRPWCRTVLTRVKLRSLHPIPDADADHVGGSVPTP